MPISNYELLYSPYTFTAPYVDMSSSWTWDTSSSSKCVNDFLAKITDELTVEIKPKEKKPQWALPGIKSVIFNGRYTTVLWEDGTHTVVTCGEGEHFDRYNGFIAAVAKKLFGSTSAAKKLMDSKDEALVKAEAERRRAEEAKKNNEENEARHQKRLRREVRKELERRAIEKSVDCAMEVVGDRIKNKVLDAYLEETLKKKHPEKDAEKE